MHVSTHYCDIYHLVHQYKQLVTLILQSDAIKTVQN